jgi:hypothetical protein
MELLRASPKQEDAAKNQQRRNIDRLVEIEKADIGSTKLSGDKATFLL